MEVLAVAVQARGDDMLIATELSRCLQMSLAAAFERDLQLAIDAAADDKGGASLLCVTLCTCAVLRQRSCVLIVAWMWTNRSLISSSHVYCRFGALSLSWITVSSK